MKKYLFLLVAVVSLALSSGQAYAQRYLPKMKGVELRGGFVNGKISAKLLHGNSDVGIYQEG